MKIRHALIISSILVILQPAYAGNKAQPDCPTISAIQAAGVKTIEQEEETAWAFYNEHNKFGTPYYWSMMGGYVTAETEEEALDNAKRGLSQLQFVDIDKSSYFTCNYLAKTNDDEFAVQLMLDDDAHTKRVFLKHNVKKGI